MVGATGLNLRPSASAQVTQKEDWVEAIRVFIRDNLENKNWLIVKNKEKNIVKDKG